MQVIINMTFDVVMATSAVSDMTEGFGCYSRDLDENKSILNLLLHVRHQGRPSLAIVLKGRLAIIQD